MKYIICFSLIFLNFIPIQASQVPSILVYGGDMQTIFLLTQTSGNSLHIDSIPTSTLLPIVCANNAVKPISSISNETTQNCLERTLESSFKIRIEQYVYLDLSAIEQDYELSLKHHQLLNFTDFQAYFESLGEQIDASLIWKYHSYMRTNLDLMDLYDFYSLYTSDDFQLSYGFLQLFQVKQKWIPLSYTFYDSILDEM